MVSVNFVNILNGEIMSGTYLSYDERTVRKADNKRALKINPQKKERKIIDTGQFKMDFDKEVVDKIKTRKVNQTVTNAIGWVGGKHKVANKLISMVPEHDGYAEVFFGGGALFFKKPKVGFNAVNDLNSNLTTMYEVMRDKPEKFWHYAHYFLYARDIFEHCVEKYKTEEWKELGDVQRAVMFYFMIRVAYNNNVNAGYLSKDQEYGIYDDYWKVIKIGEKLQNVLIENVDYRNFIEHILKLADRDKIKMFFYMDPPYVIAEKSDYYEYIFSNSEHSDLARACDKINKAGHYFMLSYEDIQLLRDIYRQYTITPLTFKYSLTTGSSDTAKEGKEILVTNFRPIEQPDLFEEK